MTGRVRGHWRFIAICVLVLVSVGVGLVVLTDTAAEHQLRSRLGLPYRCIPTVDESRGWRREAPLPKARDEARTATLANQIYVTGGVTNVLEYGEPSPVPGVRERVRVETIDQTLRFDPATGRYQPLAPMPEALNHHVMESYRGRLYVAGGFGAFLLGADPRKDTFQYDPRTDRWSRLPPQPTARGAATAAVVGSKLHVVGGMGANGRLLPTHEAYDFRTRRWQRLADLPTPREHAAGATLDGRFYVIGGRVHGSDAVDVVERYDPRTDGWDRLAGLPQRSGSLGVEAFSDKVLAVGGDDDAEGWVTGATQAYDPATDRWSQLPPMRTWRHGMGTSLAGGRLYAVGGSECALFAASDANESFDLRLVNR